MGKEAYRKPVMDVVELEDDMILTSTGSACAVNACGGDGIICGECLTYSSGGSGPVSCEEHESGGTTISAGGLGGEGGMTLSGGGTGTGCAIDMGGSGISCGSVQP